MCRSAQEMGPLALELQHTKAHIAGAVFGCMLYVSTLPSMQYCSKAGPLALSCSTPSPTLQGLFLAACWAFLQFRPQMLHLLQKNQRPIASEQGI